MTESSSPAVAPRSSQELARGSSIGFGVSNLIAAALVAYGVFVALPARYWVIDGLGTLVSLALAASALGLLGKTSWAAFTARIASGIVLGLGLVFVGVLAITASYLGGVYDQVGHGGALILLLVAALALPYLVVLPAAELLWLGPRAARGKSS